ncbi:MAG: nitroreductase family protein [Eubacteriales bacterium]|nr:nitroreductase family protein [Eubacteriales bacterium]
MEFYDVINSRRTIREFESKAIPQDALRRILDAGLKAPSSDHLRQWAPVVLTKRAAIEAVAQEIRPYPDNIAPPPRRSRRCSKSRFLGSAACWPRPAA